MTPIGIAALLVWPFVTIFMFVTLPARRALLWSYMLGWLFLPQGGFDFPGIPGFGKIEATGIGAWIGILLFDPRPLSRFRFGWADIPLLVWTFCPIATSMSNQLGIYDGCSAAFGKFLTFMTPVLFGRIYFTKLEDLQELVKVFVMGALLYLPFTWLEMRFSPQLHRILYGFHQHSFAQTMRYGGYRPMVFLQHGLALASFMASSTVLSYWLWRSRALARVANIPISAVVGVLAVTTVFCRSGNGVLEMLCGILAYTLCRIFPFRLLALAALLVIPGYMLARATNAITIQQIVDFVSLIDRERAGSLHARLRQEDHFVRHATKRIVFGHGGWNRMFPLSEDGSRLTRGVDGNWILVLSKHGVVGLLSWLFTLMIGPVLFFLRASPQTWTRPPTVVATAISVLIVLFMFDNLVNAMSQPFYLLTAGALISTAYFPVAGTQVIQSATSLQRLLPPRRRLVAGGGGSQTG